MATRNVLKRTIFLLDILRYSESPNSDRKAALESRIAETKRLHEAIDPLPIFQHEIAQRRDILYANDSLLDIFAAIWVATRGTSEGDEISEEAALHFYKLSLEALTNSRGQTTGINAQEIMDDMKNSFGALNRSSFIDGYVDFIESWADLIVPQYFDSFLWSLLDAVVDTRLNPPRLRNIGEICPFLYVINESSVYQSLSRNEEVAHVLEISKDSLSKIPDMQYRLREGCYGQIFFSAERRVDSTASNGRLSPSSQILASIQASSSHVPPPEISMGMSSNASVVSVDSKLSDASTLILHKGISKSVKSYHEYDEFDDEASIRSEDSRHIGSDGFLREDVSLSNSLYSRRQEDTSFAEFVHSQINYKDFCRLYSPGTSDSKAPQRSRRSQGNMKVDDLSSIDSRAKTPSLTLENVQKVRKTQSSIHQRLPKSVASQDILPISGTSMSILLAPPPPQNKLQTKTSRRGKTTATKSTTASAAMAEDVDEKSSETTSALDIFSATTAVKKRMDTLKESVNMDSFLFQSNLQEGGDLLVESDVDQLTRSSSPSLSVRVSINGTEIPRVPSSSSSLSSLSPLRATTITLPENSLGPLSRPGTTSGSNIRHMNSLNMQPLKSINSIQFSSDRNSHLLLGATSYDRIFSSGFKSISGFGSNGHDARANDNIIPFPSAILMKPTPKTRPVADVEENLESLSCKYSHNECSSQGQVDDNSLLALSEISYSDSVPQIVIPSSPKSMHNPSALESEVAYEQDAMHDTQPSETKPHSTSMTDEDFEDKIQVAALQTKPNNVPMDGKNNKKLAIKVKEFNELKSPSANILFSPIQKSQQNNFNEVNDDDSIMSNLTTGSEMSLASKKAVLSTRNSLNRIMLASRHREEMSNNQNELEALQINTVKFDKEFCDVNSPTQVRGLNNKSRNRARRPLSPISDAVKKMPETSGPIGNTMSIVEDNSLDSKNNSSFAYPTMPQLLISRFPIHPLSSPQSAKVENLLEDSFADIDETSVNSKMSKTKSKHNWKPSFHVESPSMFSGPQSSRPHPVYSQSFYTLNSTNPSKSLNSLAQVRSTHGPWIPDGALDPLIHDKSNSYFAWEQRKDMVKYVPHDPAEIRMTVRRQESIREVFENFVKDQRDLDSAITNKYCQLYPGAIPEKKSLRGSKSTNFMIGVPIRYDYEY